MHYWHDVKMTGSWMGALLWQFLFCLNFSSKSRAPFEKVSFSRETNGKLQKLSVKWKKTTTTWQCTGTCANDRYSPLSEYMARQIRLNTLLCTESPDFADCSANRKHWSHHTAKMHRLTWSSYLHLKYLFKWCLSYLPYLWGYKTGFSPLQNDYK